MGCSGGACDAIEPLLGFTIGVTADRRSDAQAELLTRLGADVVHGATIRTMPWFDDAAITSAIHRLVADPPDILVANTGIGMRAWVDFAGSRGLEPALLDVLSRARIVARGPKAAGEVARLGLVVADQCSTERLDDLVRSLDPAGKVVAVQLSGTATTDAVASLRARGAHVVEVPVYRWTIPDDTGPAARVAVACADRRLDAVTFTSPPALRHFLAVAAEIGRGDEVRAALTSDVICACVGPATAQTAQAAGIARPVSPARGRLGLLVKALTEELHGRHRHYIVGTRDVVVQGAVVASAGAKVTLADRERSLLSVLVRRPGAVVSRDTLFREVWGGEGAAHVVEMTVSRLRRRLLPTGIEVRVAPRRGYFVAATEAA